MTQNSRILIADDEPDIIEFLQFNFQKEGFEVWTAENGRSAIDFALKYQPDVILMDVMMPVMDGIEACREIRQRANGYDPLICLLTARGEDYSQLAGFSAGADDYMVKPISIKVLLLRIRSLLKIKNVSGNPVQANGSTGNDIVINREYYSVMKNNREIHLPRKEFEILYLMASRPNRLFSRDEIFSHIWGYETNVSERTMDVYIRKIRSKIGEEHIKTVKGVGYKFIQ